MKPNPEKGDNGLPWCTDEKCEAYDGKRCKLTGFRPGPICEPAVIEIVGQRESLRAALIQADRHLSLSRIWGGMGWKYHAMPEFRVKNIADIVRNALDALGEVPSK